jgi:hypothetical protein
VTALRQRKYRWRIGEEPESEDSIRDGATERRFGAALLRRDAAKINRTAMTTGGAKVVMIFSF